MEALVYTGPKQLKIVTKDKSIPGLGEALIKIKACGICGSDIQGYLGITGRRTPPMVMGHEFSGKIEALGDQTSLGFKIGDRVAVQPCISCWECEKCKEGHNNVCETRSFIGALDCDGAMQEYIVVPEKLLFKLPDDMSYSTGALIEALAVAFAGVEKAGDIEGENIAIIGAGTIGLLALAVVKSRNPKTIIVSDLSRSRLKTAKKMGADITINPKDQDLKAEVIKELNGGLVDVAIEAVGISHTVNQAISILKPQGKCIWIGNSEKNIEIDMQNIVTRELKIYGSYIYSHADFGKSISFIEDNKLDLSAVITKEITLTEAPDLIEELSTNTENHLKCIIKF